MSARPLIERHSWAYRRPLHSGPIPHDSPGERHSSGETSTGVPSPARQEAIDRFFGKAS